MRTTDLHGLPPGPPLRVVTAVPALLPVHQPNHGQPPGWLRHVANAHARRVVPVVLHSDLIRDARRYAFATDLDSVT